MAEGNPPQTTTDFEVQPPLIKTTIKQGETKLHTITIKNTGTTTLNIKIDPQNLSHFMVFDPDSLTLQPGETKEIKLAVTASESEAPDVITGKILFKSETLEKSVIGIIEIKPKIAIFDVNLTIPQPYREIMQGEGVLAEINISNFGDLKGIDININYIIKDDENNIIFTRDEMMAIQDFISIERILPTSQNIKTGTHILIIKVTYGNYTGTASDTFNIKPKQEKPTQPGITWKDIILAGIILMLCAITLYFIIISKRGEGKLEEIRNMFKKIRQSQPKTTKPHKKTK